MDKSCMNLLRASVIYMYEVDSFFNAFANGIQCNEILCLCRKFNNLYWATRNIVREHLV